MGPGSIGIKLPKIPRSIKTEAKTIKNTSIKFRLLKDDNFPKMLHNINTLLGLI